MNTSTSIGFVFRTICTVCTIFTYATKHVDHSLQYTPGSKYLFTKHV